MPHCIVPAVLQQIFQALDKDGDGKVSKAELKAAMGGPMKLRNRLSAAATPTAQILLKSINGRGVVSGRFADAFIQDMDCDEVLPCNWPRRRPSPERLPSLRSRHALLQTPRLRST